MKYDFTSIEKKWQQVWEDKHVFEASADAVIANTEDMEVETEEV